MSSPLTLFKTKIFPVACLGGLIGIFSFFSLPVLMVLTLTVCVIRVTKESAATADERQFITYAIAWAMGIRIIFLFVFFGYVIYKGIGSDIFGDARSYEIVAVHIRELVTGMPAEMTPWLVYNRCLLWLQELWPQVNLLQFGGWYTVPGIAYWYGLLNVLWGQSFLASKIMNALLWVVASYWVYLLFRDRFTSKNNSFTNVKGSGLKLGLTIVLFSPSALIFSSSGLKDSLLFFLIIAIIFSSHMLERFNRRCYAVSVLLITPLLNTLGARIGFSMYAFPLVSLLFVLLIIVIFNSRYWVSWGLLIIVSGLLLSSLRENICIIVLIVGLLITLVHSVNFKKIFAGIILILLFIFVISGTNAWNQVSNRLNISIKKIISVSALQSYNTAYGYSAYHIYPERIYVNRSSLNTVTYSEAFVGYFRGLRYVFLEPAPWSFKTLLAVAMFPETLFMWFLVPFIIPGLILMWRINSRMAFPITLFLFIMTSLLALYQGNMGTLVRTRCMVMPWYFMIGALGLVGVYSRIFRTDNKIGSSDFLVGKKQALPDANCSLKT